MNIDNLLKGMITAATAFTGINELSFEGYKEYKKEISDLVNESLDEDTGFETSSSFIVNALCGAAYLFYIPTFARKVFNAQKKEGRFAHLILPQSATMSHRNAGYYGFSIGMWTWIGISHLLRAMGYGDIYGDVVTTAFFGLNGISLVYESVRVLRQLSENKKTKE